MWPRIVILTALSLSLIPIWGCEDQPGETIRGRVHSDQPLTLPLSGKKACVARLTVSRGADVSSGGTSMDTLEHQWAPGATITVAGAPLAISGTKGDPTYTEFGDEWRWNKSSPNRKPPAALFGWGHDSTFEALTNDSGVVATRYLSVNEEFSPCGSEISVRAIRKGDTLSLVDTNTVDASNTLRASAAIFAGFFCCAVFPIVLLIGFVVRRSMKRREADGIPPSR